MLIPVLVFTMLGLGPVQPGTAVAAPRAQLRLAEIAPPSAPGDALAPDLAGLGALGLAGDLEAQAALGAIYYMGQGVPVDWARAQFWLRKAAARGHAGSQVKLAAMCFLGQGMPVDLAQSVDWFRKAAEQGDPHAQSCLGVMFATGVGVPQDLVEAYSLLLQAGAGGVASAVETFIQVRRMLPPEQIKEGNRRAREAMERGSSWQP